MKVIYKYPIEEGIGTVTLPCDKANDDYPEILPKVVMQNHRPQIYAVVNPNYPDTIEVETVLVGTGHPLPGDYDDFIHLDTVQDGPFVWHIFIKAEEE